MTFGLFSPRQQRTFSVVAWVLIDGIVWIASLYLALWLRADFRLDPTLTRESTLLLAIALAFGHAAVALLTGAYSRVNVRGTFDEVRALVVSSGTATAAFLALVLIVPDLQVPRTVSVLTGVVAYLNMLATRFIARSVREMRTLNHKDKAPVIIFGAGSAGRLLVHNLLNDSNSPWRPVAFLDDDRAKQRRWIAGVRVKGRRPQLQRVAARTGAEHMVIAIPSASSDAIAELRSLAEDAGITPLVLPPLSQMVGREVTGADIREINLEDVLGRRPITLDSDAIGAAVRGRVVLVTGAGGSIGSELCRQLSRFRPASLVMLDRDESALQAVSLDLDGDALLTSRNLVLADIRDVAALRAAFAEHRPDIVFHAAALKHLPLLENYPVEAWKSNVLGTLNVLEAAAEIEVQTFVNISTDKAADPTSVLGYSKRIAERLTAGYGLTAGGRYFSVRFGNVLGSRGSVIPAFQAQIQRGGPVTVTHPDAQRYFMLIPEACQLVMQAAAIGRDGEVMVLDMGRPVRILDVARALIGMSGKDVDITFTGLRHGEKLSEDLFHSIDDQRPTEHPLVSAVDVPPMLDSLRTLPVSPELVGTYFRRFALGELAPAQPGPLSSPAPRQSA